jgi:drug/metabolite transporter (DMT)-like permease
MLVLCTVVWGGTFPAVKFALDFASPWVIVTVRFFVAGGIFIVLNRQALRNLDRETLLRGMALGACFFAGFGLQTIGLQYTTASRSAFLTETLIIFTPILAFLLYRRAPGQATVAGIGIVIAGLYLLTSPAGLWDINRGDVVTLLCAVAFSLYIIGVDKWSTPGTRDVLSTVQCFTVALLASPIAYSEGFRFLAYLALPGTVLVIALQMRYQPQTTPARAGVIFALEPVFAMLYAVLLSLETASGRAVIGAAIVTAGVVWSELGTVKDDPRRKTEKIDRIYG